MNPSPYPNALIEHATTALAGALLVQRMQARRIDLDALPENERHILIRSTADELATFGIDPQLLAQVSAAAFFDLYSDPRNRDAIVTGATDLLWSILGSPEGGVPPEIYAKAGSAMHLLFLGLFSK